MPVKQYVAATLAITALIAVIAAGVALMLRPIPQENKDLVNIVLMALVGYAGTGIGFYLGSSFGSAVKNQIIAEKLEDTTDQNEEKTREGY